MLPEQRAEYFHRKTQEGFEVLEPNPTELLLDLDWDISAGGADQHIKELKKRLARLSQLVPIEAAFIKPSPQHYHGKVVMKTPVCFLERQAFELMLGSDPCRAIHNLKHHPDRQPFGELLSTLPGPWTRLEWVDEDAR